MGVNINKRIFGSDLPNKVKQKLALRQALNQTSDFGEAVTMVNDNIVEAIDMNQFNFSGNGEVIADLSSRTPFVRMWTAVEIRTHSNVGVPQTADDIGKPGKDEIHVKIDNKIQKKVVSHYEKIVYEIGNHINNEFSDVLNQRQGNALGGVTSKDVIPNVFETNNNEFMKPEAGITSITSGTEGSLGSIKKTTVNFVVHNFHDYDKIYSRYFMRPGAQIFVDFGWDAIKTLYDPWKVIDNTSDLYKDPPDGRGTNIEDILFGEFGYVTESEGDLETLIGVVTSFDSKIKANGSVECSLEIISKNAALIHGTVDTKLKNRIMYLLDAEIMNYAASHFEVKKFETQSGRGGHNFGTGIGGKHGLLSTNWTTSAENINEFNDIARLFAASQLSSNGSGIGNIPSSESALGTGVYWQTLFGKDGKPIPGNTSNIYLSYGLFEDIILNGNFGVGSDLVNILGHTVDGGNFESSFDSSNSFLRYDENLFNRQKEETDATKLSFLYPSSWGGGTNETYNIKHNKVPARTGTIVDEKFIYDKDERIIDAKWGKGQFDKFEKYDRDNHKIPLREVFISLKVIKDGFNDKKTETISDALNYILNKMNEDSYNVFNLKLGSNRQDGTKLSTLDHNLLNIKSDGDEFDKLFTFKPMSPNSIVKSYDLSITTPKNELQSMLAIQSLPSGKSIFPLSAVVDKYLAMNMTSQDNSEVGVVYLPEIGSYQSDKMELDDVLESAISFNFIDVINDSSDGFSQFSQLWADDASSTFLHALDKTKTEGGKTDETDKKGSESNITDDGFEIMNTNAKVASSLAEYYGFLAKDNVMDKIPTVIPATLSLSIYGISSLVPGDIFKVDYLPERQRKRLYFQVTKVTHNVSSTTWTTQLETVPRIRPSDKFKSGLYNKPSDIVISQKIFNQLGIKSLNKHPAYMSGLKVTHLTNDMKSVVDESSNLIVDKVFTFVAKKDAVETVQLPLVSSGYRKSKHKRARQHTTRTPVYDSFKNMTEFNISSISGKLTDTGKKAEGSLSQDWTYYKYTYEVDYKSGNMYRLILFKNSIVGPNGVELNWMIFPNTSSSTDVETGLKLWQRIVMVNSSVRTMALTVETDLAALIHEEKGGDVKYDVRCNVCETLDEASCTNDENSQFCEWYEPWTWTNYCKQKDCCDETRSSNIGYDGEYIYACGS